MNAASIIDDVLACSQSTPIDYMAMLKIEKTGQTIADEVIKKQFKKLAKFIHPDRCKLKDAEEAFKHIHQAYQILTNNPNFSSKYEDIFKDDTPFKNVPGLLFAGAGILLIAKNYCTNASSTIGIFILGMLAFAAMRWIWNQITKEMDIFAEIMLIIAYFCLNYIGFVGVTWKVFYELLGVLFFLYGIFFISRSDRRFEIGAVWSILILILFPTARLLLLAFVVFCYVYLIISSGKR